MFLPAALSLQSCAAVLTWPLPTAAGAVKAMAHGEKSDSIIMVFQKQRL